jgi:hypothetical protein
VKLRVIVHAATGDVLATDLRFVSNPNMDQYLRTYMPDVGRVLGWVVDVDSTVNLQRAGLARHMYLTTSAYSPPGKARKHLDISQSTVNGVVRYQPVLSDNPPVSALLSMQSQQGCRFLSSPLTFDLSTKGLVLDNIIAANAPVFLHHHLDYLPIDVAEFLPHAILQGPNNELISPLLDEHLTDVTKKDWSLYWSPPHAPALGPAVYVRVTRSRDIASTGFTDIEYSMFYPPILDVHGTLILNTHGWVKLSLRLDNDTRKLDSVLFNGNKRM